VLRPFIQFHLTRVIPLLGRLISGQAEAYRYLPASTAAFLTPEALGAIMVAVGLWQVRYRRLMFGTIAIHVGVKE
jgi:demethylmenaquinone methyltransferase/2-methoxy-6-polyprenyl-1,4-benzoquinol methylase